jgi:hypothetical protein
VVGIGAHELRATADPPARPTGRCRPYAEDLMRDLSLAIDGRPVTLGLQSWSLASLPQMASGQGESTVTMAASFSGGEGPHELTLDNWHQRRVAAYLVNAAYCGKKSAVENKCLRSG